MYCVVDTPNSNKLDNQIQNQVGSKKEKPFQIFIRNSSICAAKENQFFSHDYVENEKFSWWNFHELGTV